MFTPPCLADLPADLRPQGLRVWRRPVAQAVSVPSQPLAWMGLEWEWQEGRVPPAPGGVNADLDRLHKWCIFF